MRLRKSENESAGVIGQSGMNNIEERCFDSAPVVFYFKLLYILLFLFAFTCSAAEMERYRRIVALEEIDRAEARERLRR